jgi:SnoaL-like domain
MTDLDLITTWIDGYVRAWNSNDPGDIGALFTDAAEYYTAPFREPWRGREQIVAQWLEHKDEPGETTFEWRPVAVTDDLAIVQGTTMYPTQTYSNLWVIRFDADGRCREYTEWWMEQPPAVAGADGPAGSTTA